MPIIERPLTDAEYAQVKAGFNRHATEHGNPPEASDRFGFVASENGAFIGCSSGLAYRKTTGYSDWFYLTDLFVEKPFRERGLGSELLQRLEQKIITLGIANIWTWTAGYEAPGFYLKHGYTVFCEMPAYYTNGHARIGLRKPLPH